MATIAVLDACVLYSAPLRDFLLYLAQQKLYEPKWSDQINDEWIRSVLKNRPDLNSKSFDRIRLLLNDVFPKANVTGFEHLQKELTLPDVNDVHVLAAALKSDAGQIVTFNIKDFPSEELAKHSVKVVHPDDFLVSIIQEFPIQAVLAFETQLSHLTNPPISASELLEKFRNVNLQKSATLLEMLL
jgi:predicted nucleic acid-binding protein